jgi:acyl-CoA synthetase (AMP-forming)/AMP-acid ligase II
MYVSGGENVYPAEVERALCEHPGVLMWAVVGVRDERWGEVGRAFVVRAPARGATGGAAGGAAGGAEDGTAGGAEARAGASRSGSADGTADGAEGGAGRSGSAGAARGETGDGAVGEAELLAFLRERLARYKVPASVRLIPELPLSPQGKVLKRALR